MKRSRQSIKVKESQAETLARACEERNIVPIDKNHDRGTRLSKVIQTLMEILTDEDLESVAQVYRSALHANQRHWVDEGKDPHTGRARGHWEIIPDHKTRLAAANMIAAYKEGLPVQRQVVLSNTFKSADELIAKVRNSPALMEAVKALNAQGVAVEAAGEIIDVETVVQKTGSENEADSTEKSEGSNSRSKNDHFVKESVVDRNGCFVEEGNEGTPSPIIQRRPIERFAQLRALNRRGRSEKDAAMKRVALYCRVSTGEQTVDPQRLELAEFCRQKGWRPTSEYADQISGARFSRTGLDRLMADVWKGKIDVVVCVKMDRLGRSLPHLAQMIAEFDANGVALVCTSQGIDTSEDNPCGRLQMHVLMAVADFERSLIRERTRAGLAAARAQGVRLGRPRFKVDSVAEKYIETYRNGMFSGGIPTLAQLLGCSTGKAHALVKSSSGTTLGVDQAACPGEQRALTI